MFHPIFMVLNPIFYNVSPKIVIFHELLIVETCNKCHWIWHASNPKYAPFKKFQCILPSQNQQNVKFWLFPELPLTKNWKKPHQFAQGKSVCKGLKIYAYRFLGMLIAMHYVRNLCDKYFFELLWFFCILYGKVKILGYEVWCRDKMGHKEDCWICSIPFSWFWTPCSTMCLLKLPFFMNCLL